MTTKKLWLLPFGPYKGRPLEDAPPDYLKGLYSQPWLYAETKKVIHRHLWDLWEDPGRLKWPILDGASYKGKRVEEIYELDPNYLDWALGHYEQGSVGKFLQRFLRCQDFQYCPPRGMTGSPEFEELSRRLHGWVINHYDEWHPESDPDRGGFDPTSGFGGDGRKPSSWYLSDYQDLATDEMMRTSTKVFFGVKGGKAQTLWTPPRYLQEERSDFFFVSNYKTEDGPWLARYDEKDADQVALWAQCMEDIHLLGVGVETAQDLKSRFKVAWKNMKLWYGVEIHRERPRWKGYFTFWPTFSLQTVKWMLIQEYKEAYERLTRATEEFKEWDLSDEEEETPDWEEEEGSPDEEGDEEEEDGTEE